jgi:hypothetical protein
MFHPDTYGYGWMMGGNWGISHWLVFALMAAVIVYPVGLILRRLGFSPLWSMLVLVPGINLIGLWVVALAANSDGTSKETTV